MPAAKLPYGKPVKLLIDFQGFPDGRTVRFEIWRRKGQKEEVVSNVLGVTKGGKGIGLWTPAIERKEVLPLKKEIQEMVEEERYYFIARIDDKEAKSGHMMFTYPLNIYLKDTNGKPVDGAKYTITFSDGSKKQGVFKNGLAEFKDAPTGRFELKLDEYEFIL